MSAYQLPAHSKQSGEHHLTPSAWQHNPIQPIQGIQTFIPNTAWAQTPTELISPMTPAAGVVNQPPSSGLLDAVVIGGCAPPVPKKLAEKIWSREFVDFDLLLPANLGAPELTMLVTKICWPTRRGQ